MAYAAILRALGGWDNMQLAAVLLNRLNDIFEQEPEQGHDRSRLDTRAQPRGPNRACAESVSNTAGLNHPTS